MAKRPVVSPAIAPRFSILTPVYNPPLGAFLACAAGVRNQTDPDWEWCVVDDCSTRVEVREALDRLSGADERIRVRHRSTNGGIVAATNDAVAMAAGELVVLLDHDDKMIPTALADVGAMLDGPGGDEIDYLYTDEAHVLTDGRETAHFLKPDWSPERFRSSMYTCHLSVLRRRVIDEIGGFRTGFDGSQDHDLILRATEAITAAGRRIAHLPLLTYHWRNVSSSVSRASDTLDKAIERGRRAVQEQCDRLGIDAEVVHGEIEGCYRLLRRLPPATTATVVVATAGELSVARPYRLAAAETLRRLSTTMPNVRLVVAHPASLPASLVDLLDDACGERWERLPVAGDWGLAVALDRAIQAYPSDVLVSVAAGLVPVSPEWLETLAGLALQPGTGLVGGLIATTGGVVVHAGWDTPNYRWYELEGMKVGTTSSGNDLFIERECSQVSLGAAAIAAPHWHELKHTAAAAVDWNGAGKALSDALVGSGLATLWTPFARFDRVVTID